MHCKPQMFKTQMAPSKKKSKSKTPTLVASTSQDMESQDKEPSLSQLSQELEKRARKRTRTVEDSGSNALSQTSPPSKVLKAPEGLPADLIQEMRVHEEAWTAAARRDAPDKSKDIS